jgi:Glycine-zipper domain
MRTLRSSGRCRLRYRCGQQDSRLGNRTAAAERKHIHSRIVVRESSRPIQRFWRGVALSALALVVPAFALAQSPPQLYIYPLKKQSVEQQDRDRYECHRWAVQQTGCDPSKTYPNNPSYQDPKPYRPSGPQVLRGAGRGAALGAVGGAITGNAGKGAAAGAAMGGLMGGFRKMDERRRQAAQEQANAASALASQQMNYTRAMAACLEGRGYSVK